MFSKHVSPDDLFYCDLWSGYTIMYNTFSQRPWYKLSSRWYFIGFPNSVGIFFVFNLSFPLLFLLIIQIPVRALARCFKKKLSSFASLSSLGSDRRLQKIDLFSNAWTEHVKSWALRKIIIRKAKISSLIYILMMLQKKAGTDSNNELYYASGELLNVGTRDK